MKKIWLIVILLILSFAVIGCSKNVAPLSPKDFDFEKVKLGQNIKDVIASLGNPKEVLKEEVVDYLIYGLFDADLPDADINGYVFENIPGIITNSNGVVVFITPGKGTPRGIDSTSKSKDVINAYGKNFKKIIGEEDTDLYRYELVKGDIITVLGFLVNKKSDKVTDAGIWVEDKKK